MSKITTELFTHQKKYLYCTLNFFASSRISWTSGIRLASNVEFDNSRGMSEAHIFWVYSRNLSLRRDMNSSRVSCLTNLLMIGFGSFVAFRGDTPHFFFLQRVVLFWRDLALEFDFWVIISCQYFFPKAELTKARLHGTKTIVWVHTIEVIMM